MTSTSDPDPAPADTRPRRDSRVPAGFLAALLAVVLGVGGLVVGARDQAGSGTTAGPAAAAPVTGTTVGDLTVYDAYIRQPASPDVAAAYLSVRNDGDTPDRLSSAYCGAATTTTVHADSAAMQAGQEAPATPLAVPAKQVAALTPAKGHIMLDKLTGTLRAGDTVSLLLRFDKAGSVLVDVPVIGITAPAPGGATS
ncbi:MAG TPA: copper chaperone PCu(A)C [Mycobacteriales bacterium]